MVIYSIVFVLLRPTQNNPRVELEQDESPLLATVKSPKSAAFPNVDIVIYSIVLVALGLAPPPITPRVDDEHAAG